MTTHGMRISPRWALAAAALFLVADAGLALDVSGTLVTQDDKSFTGVIRWKASKRVYGISKESYELEIEPGKVKSLTIPEPAGLRDALKAVQEGRAQAAIPVLERVAVDYTMLQWDETATRALVDAYLASGDAAGAVRACEKVIAVRPEAAYAGEMAPRYWQALLKSGKTDKLEDLLGQAITTGGPEATATALLMRGDSLFSKGDFKAALKDGYLRVVTLYRGVRSAQPEALFKAAKAFDQLSQSTRAEVMRKQLLTEYGNSEWANQIKKGGA